MKQQTVLLTGFEPFNNESINPAWEAVKALDGWQEPSFCVQVRQLPCVFGLANTVMSEAVAALNPAIVIAVGQAGGRCDISLERVAINIDDAPIPDNRQQQLTDQPVVAGGAAAYFATLPVKAIVQQLRAAGLPASVSQSAGTFVCNHVFYGLMDLAAQRAPTSTLRAGFIHIPFLPQQAASRSGAPSMAAEQVIEGLRIAVRTTLSVVTDVVVREGALH